MLRFITAGNVDDGKSTLIGRLLYDANSIYSDQLNILQNQSNKNDASIDLSFVTDGLRAERARGITIDVAYKYFATQNRKFIIADAPGHEEYTRNMITGASNADLIILLIDVRKGICTQTKRHASIASLMGIKKAVVAINKMDLVAFSEEIFLQICQDFEDLKSNLAFDEIFYLPISALLGENVVEKSQKMPWYLGKTLLQILEEVEIHTHENLAARFQVQYILNTENTDNQGYAGLVLSGNYQLGEEIVILPENIKTKIHKIERNLAEVEMANAGENVVLYFEQNFSLKRGDSILKMNELSKFGTQIKTWIAWLGDAPLAHDKTYILQHRFKRVNANIELILQKWNVNEWIFEPSNQLILNDIAQIIVKTDEPLYYDAFFENNQTGNAILIDESTFDTVAALMFIQ